MIAVPRRIATVAVLAAAFVGGVAGAANADGELAVEVTGGGPLLDLSDLAPGSTGGATATATNNAGEAAQLALRIVGLVDDDNGCNRPEEAAGDVTCGAGGGELSRDLLIAIAVDGQEQYAGSLRDMAADVVELGTVAAGDTVDLDFSYEFELSSGNETQTDRVGFDVEIVLSQDLATEVAGVQLQNDSGALSSQSFAATRFTGASLARTGSALGDLVYAGAAVAAVGSLIALEGRRRRRLVPVVVANRP